MRHFTCARNHGRNKEAIQEVMLFMLVRVKYILLFLALALFSFDVTLAAKQKKHSHKSGQTQVVRSPEASLVLDAKTGKILHKHNENVQIYPASLTKMMVVYMVFHALETGKWTMDKQLYVSKYATDVIPSKLYVKPGELITVRDSIDALNVQSANDVGRVVAENYSGTEAKFAKEMTEMARRLGMKNTTFANASGLHDPKQKTTAIDLAKLTIALKRDFPQYYHYFSKTSFTYKGRVVRGHNRVIEHYPGAEGMKTGFTNPSGFNLITTATRGNKSLIAIVTGKRVRTSRDAQMVSLLDKYFGTQTKDLSWINSTGHAKYRGHAITKVAKAGKNNNNKKNKVLKSEKRSKLQVARGDRK